jgi:Pentapeptide repeats (8 copies)
VSILSTKANLAGANLVQADLTGANLAQANLAGADLVESYFFGANLAQAGLVGARLMMTNLEGANLTGCYIYGISAWDVNLVGAQQSDLVITLPDEPVITVDNLEVAQFVYLLLHNEKIREVIDTITSKAVLILGRFTPERKAVLDAIREELRRRNYLPILFDCEKPASRDLTETISTLAHMAHFIIADLTEPSSLPKELEAIVPTLAVPVQPVLEGATRPYSMFQDYWKYHWVLKVHLYESLEGLIASLGARVIAPAEAKIRELEETRRTIAEELLKQRPIKH